MNKKLQIGASVKISSRYLDWSARHSDAMYNYPIGIKAEGNESVSELLAQHFMWKYSRDRNLDICGVVVGDNGYDKKLFAYLVWCGNELGEDICYIAPEYLEIV